MNPLEQELKNALRREEPSAEFTGRVLARIASETTAKPHESWRETLRGLFHRRAWRWASAAAMCLAIVIGAFAYRRHQQEVARGEKAREQVMLALHIASSKLNVALRQVKRVDEPHDVRAVPNSD